MADSVQSTAELKKPVAPASPVTEKRMPIVGIGASAGGLEAFQQVLQALPDNTGMAFVVVQHLAPSHASLLATILQRSSKMPVVEVHDEPEVEANKVYVIPPNRDMTLADGRLKLLPRTEGRGQHRPIDTFLRSLAEHANHQAIGVVLSGTGNDGTLGLMAIKAEGGITFAQDQSAQQEGMPQSAIASGSVDFIYSPEQIAAELVRISKHPYIAPSPDGAPETPAASQADNSIEKIIKLLHESTGVDFTNYRSTTLYRRITRRMLLQNLDSVKEYLHFLTDNAAELQNLYCDILISVTSFFRDPQVFESLKHKIFPKLLKDRSAQNPLRLWIVGCSTGEEAYSMAIALAESMTDLKVQSPVQIFATDLNDVGIEKARAGIYPKTIAQEISSDRLRRFFTETGGGYQINKSIRDMCVFARQNVLADPPFSRMDLITCRNLLIYLEPVLQRKIIPLFHYALKPQGVLWLGSSESIGNFADLFEVIDSKHKLYQKKPGATPVHVTVSLTPQRWGGQSFHAPHPRYGEGHLALDLQREADRLALAKYSPPAVLVNSDFDILQFRGDTSPYLAAAPGKPSVNVMKMAREGLLVGLRSTLQRAVKEGVPARQEGLLVKSNGGFREVNLEIVPVRSLDAEAGCYLIMFEPV
jgi:two-component system CheB/CheR fusion protein